MARRNPLGKIKDVAVGSLKAPVTVAGSAVGLARGAATAGGQVTRSVTGRAASVVTGLVEGRKSPDPSAVDRVEQESTAASAPGDADTVTNSGPEPVNVTEELGLDPAPVDKPKPAKKAPAKKPMTTIDAAADPSDVDVTPADVAQAVAKNAPARKPAKRAAAEADEG